MVLTAWEYEFCRRCEILTVHSVFTLRQLTTCLVCQCTADDYLQKLVYQTFLHRQSIASKRAQQFNTAVMKDVAYFQQFEPFCNNGWASHGLLSAPTSSSLSPVWLRYIKEHPHLVHLNGQHQDEGIADVDLYQQTHADDSKLHVCTWCDDLNRLLNSAQE